MKKLLIGTVTILIVGVAKPAFADIDGSTPQPGEPAQPLICGLKTDKTVIDKVQREKLSLVPYAPINENPADPDLCFYHGSATAEIQNEWSNNGIRYRFRDLLPN